MAGAESQAQEWRLDPHRWGKFTVQTGALLRSSRLKPDFLSILGSKFT